MSQVGVSVPVVLVGSCDPGDARYDDWTLQLARAMSPAASVRADAAERLERMGFEAALDDPPPSPPPAPKRPRRSRFRFWLWQWSLLVVVLWAAAAMFRNAGGTQLCGRPTKIGGRRRNPADTCTARRDGTHARARGTEYAAPILDDLAEPLKLPPAAATLRSADAANPPGGGPSDVAAAATTLRDALGAVEPESGGRFADPEQVLALLSGIAQGDDDDGFTASPFNPVLDSVPGSGVCVAFDNTPLKWHKKRPMFNKQGEPTQRALSRMTAWLKDHREVLGLGCVWIGGWHNPKTQDTEINVTYVFHIDHKESAEAFGALQDQKTVYVIGMRETAQTFGYGGSEWTPTTTQTV